MILIAGMLTFACIHTRAILSIGHFRLVNPKGVQGNDVSGFFVADSTIVTHRKFACWHIAEGVAPSSPSMVSTGFSAGAGTRNERNENQ